MQEKVKNAIENMTGLEVADVNIKVADRDGESGIKANRKGISQHG